MDTSDKVNIAGIIVNAIIAIANLLWSRKIRKTSQPTLATADPVARPRTKKRLLSPLERRMIRALRLIQFGLLLQLLTPLDSRVYYRPSEVGLGSLVLLLFGSVLCVANIIFCEVWVIRKIRNHDPDFLEFIVQLGKRRKTKI